MVDVVLGWSVDVVVFVVCAASGEAKSAAAIDAAKSFIISLLLFLRSASPAILGMAAWLREHLFMFAHSTIRFVDPALPC